MSRRVGNPSSFNRSFWGVKKTSLRADVVLNSGSIVAISNAKDLTYMYLCLKKGVIEVCCIGIMIILAYTYIERQAKSLLNGV